MTTPRSGSVVLEPATQAFIDSLAAAGGPPIYQLSPAAAREVLAGAQAAPVDKPAARIEDTTFPVGPTGEVRIRIVRPESAAGVLPVVMHFHGGGWILGDKETHDRMTREIAVGTGAAVVFVDYDRSPEAQYPVAIEQAYAATRYVAEHGRELDIDPHRLAILGDSVGGNMAAAVTLMAKERGGPRIRVPGPVLPGDRCRFRDRLVSDLCRRALAHQAGHGVVLGCVSAGGRQAQGDHRDAAQMLRSSS